jgi:hypothetical protein
MSAIAIVLAIAALLISLASLGISAFVAVRDTAQLKITSRYMEAHEFDRAHISVTMVNAGRRPIILRMRGGTKQGGDRWVGTYLGHENKGLRLEEHQRHEHSYYLEDTVDSDIDGEDVGFDSLWFEDTLGIRHQVPKASQMIARLRSDAHGN